VVLLPSEAGNNFTVAGVAAIFCNGFLSARYFSISVAMNEYR
jgi:hypothetical protein